MASFNPFFADVDRMFDEITRGLGGAASAPSFGAVDASVDPESGALTAQLDLPGVDRDSLAVRVVGDALVVEASRNRAGTSGRILASERAAGRVRRVVRTGRPLDPEEVSADYADGVLTVVAQTRAPGRPVDVRFAGPAIVRQEAQRAVEPDQRGEGSTGQEQSQAQQDQATDSTRA